MTLLTRKSPKHTIVSIEIKANTVNPLVSDAHYSERQDKPFGIYELFQE